MICRKPCVNCIRTPRETLQIISNVIKLNELLQCLDRVQRHGRHFLINWFYIPSKTFDLFKHLLIFNSVKGCIT